MQHKTVQVCNSKEKTGLEMEIWEPLVNKRAVNRYRLRMELLAAPTPGVEKRLGIHDK